MQADAEKDFQKKKEELEKRIAEAKEELEDALAGVQGGVVFEKNGNTHVELEPSDSREILQSALYNTNIVGSTQPIKRPDYKVAIRTGEKNAVVVLDVFQVKE